ncbi:hypothetical protein H4684_003484 [Desulfomicrobium macestii]|uniref:DUF547 domain-containing protein n=1 Tax=Desulfomicrobium macestii TaxID=90731 RepID=A0ABR9H7Z0_9BACT|nr:DUF547 domain-containing protein [Desulfomicrobium macestii]MBE1426809.1 hypothetical protein [Desulfomicrobium macestii]
MISAKKCARCAGAAIMTAVLLFWTAGRHADAAGFDHAHGILTQVLSERVVDGRVDYPGLQKSPALLDRYLQSTSSVTEAQFKGWNERQQLAFLINLYNAATLRLIIDHYPLDSIKDIGNIFKGPWDQKVVSLFGGKTSLNHLEHGIIRKDYSEPRIHVALVCAASSCPALPSSAFTADALDGQLDERARLYLSSPNGLRVDRAAGRVLVSSIFKWFGEDFVPGFSPASGFDGLKGKERAVMNFIAKYVSDELRGFFSGGGYDLEYIDYDWSLNKQEVAP